MYCTRLCMLCYTMLYYVKLCSILSTLHAVYLSYSFISSLHLSVGVVSSTSLSILEDSATRSVVCCTVCAMLYCLYCV